MATKLYATKKLKEIRENNTWTQKEFADMLSVQLEQEISVSLLQKWENGERTITPEIALEISRIYRVELRELVERK